MLNELLKRHPRLSAIREDILKAEKMLIDCYEGGNKVLLCGNGGSCADCEHIVGELMKGFLKKRQLDEGTRAEMKARMPLLEEAVLSRLQLGLPAISLTSMTALNSAYSNDADPELVYAQSLMALSRQGDVLIAISTSGNSENVCAAAMVAKALGCSVLALTGATGGRLGEIADVCLCVPENETFKIQELHLPLYHYLCARTEEHFFET